MAAIKGTNVIAPVVPLDTTDVHPSHEARYGKGGYRTVATLVERDAIPAPRREAGMLVYVSAGGGSLWQLGGDLTTWTAFESGGSADLPPGTEGDVLTYVDGEWVAAEPQGGVSSWNDLTDRPTEFAPSAHAASHGPNGADELYDQSLDTTDEVTFAEITVSPDATTTATHSGHGVVVTTSPAVEGEPNNERTAYLKTSTSNSATPAGEFGVVAAADTGAPVTSRITGAAVIGDGNPSAVLTLRAEEPNNSTLNQCYINATAPLYGDAAVTMYTTYGNYTGDRHATYGTAGIVIANNAGSPSEIRIDATGIKYPDNTVQTTAWPGTLSYTALTDLPTLGTAAAENATAFAQATHGHVVADISDFPVLFDGAYSSLTGLPTLGGAAALNVGSSAGTVAAGDHTHAQLHDRSHAITSTSDHTATAWRLFYSNASGAITELTLGNSGQALLSNGASAAPSWGSAGSNSASDLTSGTLAYARMADPTVTSPSQITASQNDYASFARGINRFTTNAARDITGMVAGSDGEVRVLTNVGTTAANTLTIKDESTSSTAANRFSVPWNGDCVIPAEGSVVVFYDGTSQRWRVI